MDKIQVLVIDSNTLARGIINHVLRQFKNIEVFHTSQDSGEVEPFIIKFNPDVVLVNIEGEESDALIMVNSLRIRFPKLPILVTSKRTEKGAKIAVSVLINGAVDVITKPDCNVGLLFAHNHFEKRLLPPIEVATQIENLEKNLFHSSKSRSNPPSPLGNLFSRKYGSKIRNLADIVVIGACLGGPHSLFSLIPQLPASLNIPFVVVQHFPQYYTKALAERLNEMSRVEVREAYDGAALTQGIVWIAPGGYHTEVAQDGTKNVLKVHRGPQVNNVRPSIDVLFNSAANIYSRNVLGVILSGYGKDGLEGAREIKELGGNIIAQDPRCSLAPEMPLTVLKENLADANYPTDKMPKKILNWIQISEETELEKYSSAVNGN